jgi:transcriptional regulator with XRE-family HTH domain
MKNPGFRTRLEALIGSEQPFAWAARVGISKGAFSRIWHEGTIPAGDILLRIKRATGVDMDWLLAGEGYPPDSVLKTEQMAVDAQLAALAGDFGKSSALREEIERTRQAAAKEHPEWQEGGFPEKEVTLAMESLLILDEELARVGAVVGRDERLSLALEGWRHVRSEDESDQIDMLRKLYRMMIKMKGKLDVLLEPPEKAAQHVTGHGNVTAGGDVSGVNVGGVTVGAPAKKGKKKK